MISRLLALAAMLLLISEPIRYLENLHTFSERQITSLDQGAVVVEALDSEVTDDPLIVGAALIKAPKEFIASRPGSLDFGTVYSQFGKFTWPARIEDFRTFGIDIADFNDLRECRDDKCDFRLSPSVLDRLRQIDFSAPDCRSQINALIRQMLLDAVNRYGTEGHVADFEPLLDESAYLFDYPPELQAYLRAYPKQELSGAQDFLYWSKENFDSKPLIRLTHLTVYRRQKPGSPILISSKHIYLSRYFDSAWTLTALVDNGRSRGIPSTYLIYLNRSRLDSKNAGALNRLLLRGRLRANARKSLEWAKRTVENEYRSAPMMKN